VGGHSDPVVTGRISDDDALHAELNRIIGELDVQLASDFERLLGVPIPSPERSVVDVRDVDLIRADATPGALVTEFVHGATAIVETRISDLRLRQSALSVAGGLLGLAAQQGGLSLGGYAASEATAVAGWAAAVVGEIDYGDRQAWGTPCDFFIARFIFVVWSTATIATGDLDEPLPRSVEPAHWNGG